MQTLQELREYRKSKGQSATNKAIAEWLGVTERTVASWIKGVPKASMQRVLARIALDEKTQSVPASMPLEKWRELLGPDADKMLASAEKHGQTVAEWFLDAGRMRLRDEKKPTDG